MMHERYGFGFPLFFMAALCLCLIDTALAATVNYTSGSFAYVVGNPATSGDDTGIGGTNDLNKRINNAYGSGNTVNVTGGTVNNGISGGTHWTTTGASASATGNEVNVGSSFAGNGNLVVQGGFARVQASGVQHVGKSAVASGNTVNISGGNFGQIFGGQAGSGDGPATADNNTVNFTGGTTKFIYGGQAYIGTSSSAYETSASGNHVIISGGTVTADVYGGYNATGARGSAINNTVTIQGDPVLAGVRLYGGYVDPAFPGDALSGNTLRVKTSGITVRQISSFQNLSFYVSDSTGLESAQLIVTGAAYINGSTVHVGLNGNVSPLQIGDTITLVDASGGSLNGTPANGNALGIQGISKAYSFQITADPTTNRLLATLYGIEAPGGDGQTDGPTDGPTDGQTDGPTDGQFDEQIGEQIEAQLKSLKENRMAGLGLLTQGQDMLEARAIPQLRALAPEPCGLTAFGVTGGGSLRYNTGSHVTVEGFNLVAGLGWNAALDKGGKGNFLFGAFFETGWGDYDTRNSPGNATPVKANGSTRYRGGGILARYDAAPLDLLQTSGNFYLETSFRAGRTDTDYASADFLTASGNDVRFDSSAPYYGAHAGAGHIWNITENFSVDLYSKYLWTRQGRDTVIIEGDRITFKKVDSQRWRSGARFAYSLNMDSGPVFTPYIGAAFEREFDSRARGTTNGIPFDSPDVKGNTGMGEAGFTFRPLAASGFSFDLGAQGYTGKREGGGGSLLLKWEF